jgi:large repetitive protein
LNAGLFEKTGGTGTSVIAPAVTNTGTIEVTAASATLDLQGVVAGTGKDEISGSSTLEFDSTVAAGQTVSFTGSAGTLNLVDPQGFAGKIGGFDTVGAGSSDTIEVAGLWVFSSFKENAGGTQGTLRLVNGANTLSLSLLGDYNFAGFHQAHANGSTLITYTSGGLDSLLHSVSGAETHAGEFSLREASGSARGDWGSGASWDGSVGHGPGPS